MPVISIPKENNLPWAERVNAISVNPSMATQEDIARMAADLSEGYYLLHRIKNRIAKYLIGDEVFRFLSKFERAPQ